MLTATYLVAGALLVLATVFLALYQAYGRGWNDHASHRKPERRTPDDALNQGDGARR